MYLPLHGPHRTQVLIVLTVLVLGFAAVAIVGKTLFSIRAPHGTPVGPSLRAGNQIATLIETREPYLVSLHHNGGKDRYRVGVLLQPLDGSGPGKVVPISGGHAAGQLGLIELLGFDGHTVWFYVTELGGVNVRTGKRVTASDLDRANSSGLEQGWDNPSRIAFGTRIELFSPDRQRLVEIDPETLKAIPAPPGRRPTINTRDAKLESFLTPFAFPSATEWIGLISEKDSRDNYKVHSWIWTGKRADDAKEVRQFHRGSHGPMDRPATREVLSSTAVGGGDFLNAAFVSATPGGEALRLSGPDGFLMVFTGEAGLKGTLWVARIDTTGRILWKVDTGLDRFLLQQILPDAHTPAFVGTRLPIPDKLSEPFLVVVDASTGAVSNHSLWR
ncbi:MAG: hypothetical protein JNL10_00545 [Verrucomicrobiales bacterium]|nr:hypothetical protein [Verrucomicrobiales bacterium]